MKQKFILEFDKPPALVFVQEGVSGTGFKLYQDGKEVKGICTLEINAGVHEPTTHRIEYITGRTSK